MQISRLLQHTRHFGLALASAGALGLVGTALAQNVNLPPDPQAGQVLAAAHCAHCHLIAPEAAGPAQADVPPFHEIANRPDTTTDSLTTFLTLPHPPMPPLTLARQEIVNLAAYILTLRQGAPATDQ